MRFCLLLAGPLDMESATLSASLELRVGQLLTYSSFCTKVARNK